MQLDEPTTGLHFEDIQMLLKVLHLDAIKTADWIIYLGPKGGRIMSQGPPESVARCKHSYTGLFLNEVLVEAG